MIMAEESDRATTVGNIASAEELLRTFQEGMELPLDWDGQRQMIEEFVKGVSVKTTGSKRRKRSKITMSWTFEPVGAVVTPTPPLSRTRR